MSGLLTDAPSHAALLAHASELQNVHLRDLLAAGRGSLVASLGHELTLDYSRQKVSAVVLDDLEKLYHERGVPASMAANQAGAEQNQSEGRSVLHTAMTLDDALFANLDADPSAPCCGPRWPAPRCWTS